MAYSHTYEWNDNIPQDYENSGLGASRIREFKDMIQDRMLVGHIWGDSVSTDGEHKFDKVVNGGSVSGTYSINLQNGRIHYIQLTGNTIISIYDTDSMSSTYSRSFLLAVKQDSTTPYTLTFPASFKFHNDQIINITPQLGWVTIYHCLSFDNGGHWIITHVGDFPW